MQQDFAEAANVLIRGTIEDFSTLISDRYGLDKDELMAMWDGEDRPKQKPMPAAECGCQHEYTRGDKSGTMCGLPTSQGSDRCSRHRAPSKVRKRKKALEFRKHRRHQEYLWNPETCFVVRKDQATEGVVGKIIEEKAGESKVRLGLTVEEVDRCVSLKVPFCANPPTD